MKPLALALLLAVPLAPVAAHGPITAVEQAKFEADRAAILAMAGTFRVRFDFQESTVWKPGYTPLERKISGGHETVLVVEDSPRRIVLQHLLVVEDGGRPMVIKHWRQDWTYEPETVLTYAGPDTWVLTPVPERMRKGRWSQTVWQTDDSPRYGAWGEWETQAGLPRWRSGWTLRPLARRDAIRSPAYDRYQAINRHQPTPTGWIHWQDNTKLGMVDGRLVPIVQEYGLNSYERFAGYDTGAAIRYWEGTKGYWAAVRAAWDEAIAKGRGLRLKEEPDAGAVTGPTLMRLAEEVLAGRTPEAKAIAEARRVIAEATGPAAPVAVAAR